MPKGRRVRHCSPRIFRTFRVKKQRCSPLSTRQDIRAQSIGTMLTCSSTFWKAIRGISAVPIVLFAALHLTNHFVGLWGAQAHMAFMLQARRVYRNPAIEIALVSCFAFQFATGIVLT